MRSQYNEQRYQKRKGEKPFWSYEYEYLKLKDKVISRCYEADNLLDALETGLNSVRLRFDDYDDNVGYWDEDGELVLNEPYASMYSNGEKDGLENTKVVFLDFDIDEDGYTIGIFRQIISDKEE